MRPATPDIDDRGDLTDYVDACATRVEGRLGVLVGYPTGATAAEFDAVVVREADRPYASASVIKLPVLYALYREHDDDLAALDEPRQLAEENRVGGTGLFHLLDAPDPSLRDLARAMIVVSDNAATNELVDYLGADAVNRAVAALEMDDTHLGRKMMTTLEDGGTDRAAQGTPDDEPVNTTSPRDCARFFAELCHGESISAAARVEQLDVLRHQKDASMFTRYFPYDLTVAHKTGWLPDAALDTGLIEPTGERPLFFAAFCDRAPHGGDATDAVAEVGDATLAWAGLDE